MSCSLVGNKCMDLVVAGITFLKDARYLDMNPELEGLLKKGKDELGRKLYDLNFEAFSYRYDGRYDEEIEQYRGYEYSPVEDPEDLFRIAKAMSDLCYQCCEGEVDKNPLYINLEKAKDSLFYYIVTSDRRYEEADIDG